MHTNRHDMLQDGKAYSPDTESHHHHSGAPSSSPMDYATVVGLDGEDGTQIFSPRIQTLMNGASIVPPPGADALCWYCHLDRDSGGELIAPCPNCHSFYAHRACLNAHRVNVDEPQRLLSCEVCHGDFHLLPSQSSSPHVRRLRFHARVLRDFFLVFCLIQFVLLLLALAVRGMDEAIAFCVPSCQPIDAVNGTGADCIECAPIRNMFFPRSLSQDHERFTYYICAIVLFLAFIGCFGICNHCVGEDVSIVTPAAPRRHLHFWYCCCRPRPYHHHHYHCNNCICVHDPARDVDCCCDCCCNACCGNVQCKDCKTDNNNNNGRSSDGKANEALVVLLVVLVFIVICFAFVGLFYGLVLATALFQRIVQRHLHVLELREIARDFPVADLAQPLDENIPYAQVVREVREML